MTRAAHHHGRDTPTSPRAVLHHTDANLCTILHTTVWHSNHFESKKLVIWLWCLVHVAVKFLVTDYIQKRRGHSLHFSFEYNLLLNFNHYMVRALSFVFLVRRVSYQTSSKAFFESNYVVLLSSVICWHLILKKLHTNPRMKLQLIRKIGFSQFYRKISSDLKSIDNANWFSKLQGYISSLQKLLRTPIKVHIFWEGHKILQNLPLTFDYSTYSQK